MTEKGTKHGDFEEIVQVRKYANHCVLTKRSSGLEPRKGAGGTGFPCIEKQAGQSMLGSTTFRLHVYTIFADCNVCNYKFTNYYSACLLFHVSNFNIQSSL